MSGIYAAVALSEHITAECLRETFERLSASLTMLSPTLEVKSCPGDEMSCLGVLGPSNSSLVHRVVRNEQSGAQLLYFGDGRCDDVILHGCLDTRDYSRLCGFFVVLRLDRLAHDRGPSAVRCTLIRDRSGSFASVFKIVDGVLLVAPRVSALQFTPVSVDELDPLGIGFLLSTGYIPAAATQFRSIRSVESGTAVSISASGAATPNRYWRYPPSLKGRSSDPSRLLEQSTASFRASIAANYDDPEHTAVFLSGGVDSRAIVAACVAHAGDPARVRTVSWGESDSVEGSDARIAQLLASALGTSHRFMDKPSVDFRSDFETACRLSDWSSDVAGMQPNEWRLMRSLAEDGMRSCLRGDQVFSNDRSVYSAKDALAVATLKRLSLQKLASELLHPEVFKLYSETNDEFLDSMEKPARYSTNDLRDLYRFENQIPNSLQSMSMYKSVYMDHRNPILDDRFLEVLPLMHGHDRDRKRLFRQILSSVAANVAQIPHSDRHSDPDQQQFFQAAGIGRSYLMDSLDDSASPVFELFDRDALVRGLDRTDSTPPIASAKRGYRKTIKRAALQGLARIHPSSAGTIGHRNRASSLPWSNAIRRFLVIKQFVDAHCR